MPRLQRGDRFAGYHIMRHIADGNVGEVYEVAAPDGERLALKRLRSDAPYAPKREERLALEGDVLAALEHVNLVRFHDLLWEDEHVALVVELVRGPDLRRLADACPDKRVPLVRGVGILRQACEGVAALHARKIVHRDLRPENILVAKGDLVKVSDCGSARLDGLSLGTTLQYDLGSVLYAPPEWMSPAQPVHPAIDVYAMAVLAYQILAGVHPFATEKMSAFEVCARHVRDVPPPLSALVPDAPIALCDVVHLGMSKDPAARPSMRGMADALAPIHDELLAPRRARARAVPLPNRPFALAKTEPAMPARAGGGTLVLPAAPAPAAPASERETQLPGPPSSEAPSTKRSAEAPGVPSGLLSAIEATPPGVERRSTAAPVEHAVAQPSRLSRAVPYAVAALSVVLAFELAGLAWVEVARPRGPEAATPAASAVPATASAAASDGGAPAPAAASSAAAPPAGASSVAKPPTAAPAAPRPPRPKAPAAPAHKAPPSLGDLPDHL